MWLRAPRPGERFTNRRARSGLSDHCGDVQALRSAVLAVPIYKKAASIRMAYNGLTHTMGSSAYALAASL